MVDIKLIVLTLLVILSVWLIDRFLLKRGIVKLNKCQLFDVKEGYWRFALEYTVTNSIFWGEIRYQLMDKSDPSTVIAGRARTLDHAKSGLNQEFLHIKKALTSTSESPAQWEIYIVSSAVVGHWNPLYKLFPLSTKKKFEVTLNG